MESGLREYLIFVLGLVPVVIAMLRVVFTAQGDSATLYTLVQTLNVPALVLGTYARFIGVLGLGLTLPLLLRNRTRAGRVKPIRMGSTGWTVLPIVFLCSVACVYPEQILDTTVPGLEPADIVRAAGWGAAVYLVARLLLKQWRREARARPWRAPAWVAGHPIEILVIAPAVMWDPLESTCRHASLSIL